MGTGSGVKCVDSYGNTLHCLDFPNCRQSSMHRWVEAARQHKQVL